MSVIHAELKQILSKDGSIGDTGDVPFTVKRHAHLLCADFIGGAWKAVPTEKVVVIRMKGGMSNMLFLCSIDAVPGEAASRTNKILLRVYFNPETESHLVAESVIFTLLSERELGPSLYGIFNGGRLEEYINSRPLKTTDIREQSMSERIARKLAHVHQLNVPISKEPSYLWEALSRWLSQLKQHVNETTTFPVSFPDGKTMEITLENLKEEVHLLTACLGRSTSKVVFCHNDLQEGNILLPLSNDIPISKDIVFIDFEYASYNFRAFDFANHFCEWSIDYTLEHKPYFKVTASEFPTLPEQELFVKAYLEASHLNADEAAVRNLLKEIRPFIPVSHLFYGIWSILSNKTSPLSFGFEEYAKQRLGYYFVLKEDLMELQK